MANSSTEEQISETIQEFTLVVEESGPSNDTAQALVAHVKGKLDDDRRAREDAERWRRWWQQSTYLQIQTYFRNDDDDLMRQCKEVTEFWKGFSRKSSVKRALEKAGVQAIDGSHPPTIETLHHVVQNLEKTQKEGTGTPWGRTKANMRVFAKTMNSHKELFSLFPSDNIYTSVLSGSVSTIILACVNHERVAEGFSMGLKQIGDNLDYLSESKNSLNTPRARKAVANAYVEVFKFLCSAMRWQASRWNRLTSTIQNTFYDDHIKSHVEEIERLARLVDRETNRQTHEGVVGLLDIGSALSSSAHQRSAADRFRTQEGTQVMKSLDDASMAFSRLGYDVTHCLTAAEEQHDYADVLTVTIRRSRSADSSRRFHEQPDGQRADIEALHSSTGTTDLGESEYQHDSESESEDSGPSSYYYIREDMELFTQEILPFVNNGVEEATKGARQDAGLRVPSHLLNLVQPWVQTNASSILWVQGPGHPSDLSPIALRAWAVMADAGIPSICFFDQRRFPNPNKLDVREAGAVCLLYTLINQLVHQLPSVIETDEVMDEAYFESLDGSWASTEFALDVIRRFLTYAPSCLVLVIHGLDRLEGRTTRDTLGQLLDIIREQSSTTVVKAFFSTDGFSRVLGDKTVYSERVDASRMGQVRSGSLQDMRM